MSAIMMGVLGLGTSTVLVEITGKLDRKKFESLKLNLASVAKKHGLRVAKFALKKSTKKATKKATKK